MMAPDASWRSPRTTESETVSVATRMREPSRIPHCPRGLESAAVPVERHLLHDCRNPLAANLYLERRSFRSGIDRHVGRSDRNSQCRAHRSASHFPTWLSFGEDRITVSRERPFGCSEPNELSLQTLLLLLRESVATDEVSLLHFHKPAE